MRPEMVWIIAAFIFAVVAIYFIVTRPRGTLYKAQPLPDNATPQIQKQATAASERLMADLERRQPGE